MVVNNKKPKVRRGPKPKPKPSFDQRLLQLERKVNSLDRGIRAFKKKYSDPKPKRERKTTGKTKKQSTKKI